MSKQIFIFTGEASGDLIASQLVKALKSVNSDIQINAMGGEELKAAGARIIIDSSRLAVIGFGEIISHLKDIYLALKQIKNLFIQHKPQLILLVDYPGFNLRVAKIAKQLGIPVFYYVSPQIWAWRYGRIHKIRHLVNHMAVLFSFEEKIYQKENVPVTFVGHPLMELAKPTLSKEEIYQRWNLNPAKPIIGLFPGSRPHEVQRLLPIMVKSMFLIQRKIPNAQFVLPLAKNLSLDHLKNINTTGIKIIQNHTHDLMSVCDAAIAASGTVTLEIAFHQVPQVIIYKLSLFSAVIVKTLLRIKQVGLCNIIAEETIAKELLQGKANPKAIAAETIELLRNQNYRANIKEKLKSLKIKLHSEQAALNAAKAVLQHLPN